MRFGTVCSGIEAASTAWEPLGWTPAMVQRDRGVYVRCARASLAVRAEPWRYDPTPGTGARGGIMNQEVRDTSIDTFHGLPLAQHKSQQDRVVEAVESIGGWVSRRQIAQHTGMETATVSARVNAQVGARLVEDRETSECPVTGRPVHKVRRRREGEEVQQ